MHRIKIAQSPARYRRLIALLICLALFFGMDCAYTEEPPADRPPMDAPFAINEGDMDFPMLTKASIDADDVPESYLSEAEHQGRVEKIRYDTYDIETRESPTVKSVMVYFPFGYDTSDESYNVLYLLHGASGAPSNYLSPDKVTVLQCLLDHMIENNELEPLIVVAASYVPREGMFSWLPLPMQVEIASAFPQELIEDIIPQIESKCRTYASSASREDIVASRDHRAIAGFSMGGVCTWYVFIQQMQAFRWFLPISEASWDDGEDGTSGIMDSDLSAQVLYDAVSAQGYGKKDFMLFVATGSEDDAFDVTTSQMVSLLKYDDMFKPGENTSCTMMQNGTHTINALYTYLYHILPSLFAAS